MCTIRVHGIINGNAYAILVQDVERHMEEHGPWQYRLSQLYDAPEVTAVVENIATEKHVKMAA